MDRVQENDANWIVRRATMLLQSGGNQVYQFALTGEELLEISDISRISQNDAGTIIGYQRPEIRKHIQDIVEYLNLEKTIFPHAIILAFSSSVKFLKQRGPKAFDGVSYAGELRIPRVSGLRRNKAAWVVDGQQRLLAIAQSSNRKLPIPVCAFITDDIETQRDQFLRINNSRPLPRGLVEELLPEVSMPISARLSPSKAPSSIVSLLNQAKDSPFFGLIKRQSMSSEQKKDAVISDGPLLKVIKESLTHPSGSLFPFRDITSGNIDFESISHILKTYWSAVRDVFPEAWGVPPNQSRLMHGVGISAMGRLMDHIVPRVDMGSTIAIEITINEIAKIRDVCRWTSGTWMELNLKWNELQYTPRHERALSSYLVRVYVNRKSKK